MPPDDSSAALGPSSLTASTSAPAPAPTSAPTSPPRRSRIAALDVLRGFALCGILLANVRPIASTVELAAPSAPRATDAWQGALVDQRFFPIFSLLFGIGFSLLLSSAADRATRPRLLLLRRLLVLLAMGLIHMFLLWRGDILTIYAAVGLLVLLPSTWLPRWAVAGLAAVLVPASLVVGGDRIVLIAGLFLLGSALTRYGVVDRIERSIRVPALLGLLLAAAAVPALWWQNAAGADVATSAFSVSFALAGLLIAGVYVNVLLVLLRTRLRPVLRMVFAPLGRMALTNYLSATVLVLSTRHVIGGSGETWTVTTASTIVGAILAAQWVFSSIWLRQYRFGPLEWLWRWATWAQRPPLRRTP
ncbi:DUF418 domain-containing protein [Actinopolymorpha pittospori]|uniref:Membrane protein YeiB n=1 Tax=Actinopolymorpha pittospori TaxID=648752 RepID=A0A927MSB7_9ACTN|nr:DUF418 domain-containing protein [Actinopolymorpha pittospori]MBE1605426.1 putative membrane protein YeiB [Actinopolymorpha pittospori]